MKGTINGTVDAPAIAVAGVWDPILPQQQQLFRFLAAEARERNLRSVVIVFDPAPGRLLYGERSWPIYNDITTRVQLIRRLGVDAVLTMNFLKKDLDGNATDFFDAVAEQIDLYEFWLGAKQTLGRGDAGSTETVRKVTQERSISLRYLAEEQLATVDVLRMLAAGDITKASRIVGLPPFRSRPRSGRVRLAWRPGIYQALPLASLTSEEERRLVEIEITQEPNKLPLFVWPDRQSKYLAFISGPGDISE